MLLIGLQYSAQLAGTVSFILATFVNFLFSKYFVFADRGAAGLQKMLAVYLVSAVGLLLNLLVLWIGMDLLHLLPLISKLAATGLVFFWNYFARNRYVFKTRE